MSDPLQYNRKSNIDHPPALYEDYKSTVLRSPKRAAISLEHTLTEITGPLFGHAPTQPGDDDLSIENGEEAQGQRIFVSGRVLDEDGHPVPNTLSEIWQCNAAGRYRHEVDQHPAPLDPHFIGQGRVITDKDGKYKIVCSGTLTTILNLKGREEPDCEFNGVTPSGRGDQLESVF